MKRKSVMSGAMIVAASVTVASDRVTARESAPEKAAIKATAEGLKIDLVRVDDDVLLLGGIEAESAGSGLDTGVGRSWDQGEDIYLAQTYFGGGSDGRSGKLGKVGKKKRLPKAKVAGTRSLVVIDPSDNQARTVLFDDKTKTYYNADDGTEIEPPAWMRQQIEN